MRVTDPNGKEWAWDGSEWASVEDIWQPDCVVAGKIIKHTPGVGYLVEFFSKTDQYQAWIREDFVMHRPECNESLKSMGRELEEFLDYLDKYFDPEVKD